MTSLDDIVAEIRNGVDLEQSDQPSSPDMLPISRIETISEGVIDFSRVKYATPSPTERQKYQLQSGDILFSHINSPEHIGKTALFRSNKPLIHGINLLLLRVNHEVCHPEYLNLYLKSFAVRARFRTRCKKAVNQASLNQDDILSLDVPIPTLPEQKRIAAILENADWLRRTRRYARQLGDTFLQSIFLEMFDSFLTKEENEVLKNVLALPLSNGSSRQLGSHEKSLPVHARLQPAASQATTPTL
jgi:type I restriction enzyme S subunit